MKKNIFLFLVFIFLFENSSAQKNNWNVYFENEQISISYKSMKCDYKEMFDQELIVLKVNNFTEEKITIQWETELWYDDVCINCETENEEYRSIITIDKQETLTGSCYLDNKLRIFSKFTNNLEEMPGLTKIVELTKFELKNIIIRHE